MSSKHNLVGRGNDNNNIHTLCLRKKRGVELFAITSSTINQF